MRANQGSSFAPKSESPRLPEASSPWCGTAHHTDPPPALVALAEAGVEAVTKAFEDGDVVTLAEWKARAA
jgi:hypothetical protein